MSELFINKTRACAVTGHRVLYRDFDEKKLENLFVKLLDKGFDTFLIGMAIGFDTVCFKILEKLREKYPLKIIACVPCRHQDLKFSLEQKVEYRKMLISADEKIILSEEYTPSCMQKRNQFMVDNASVLISYLRRNYGGTYKTCEYALKHNVPIIKV